MRRRSEERRVGKECPAGRWPAYDLLHHELALLDDHLFRLTRSEEGGLADPLGPHRLLVPIALQIDREEKIVDAVHQERRFVVLGGEHEGVEPHPFFFFSSRRRHTRCSRDWSSDVCSSDLPTQRWTPSLRWYRSSPPL